MAEQDLQGFLASKKEDDAEANPEEEVQGNWKPIVELEAVAVVTGEETMDLKFKKRARLYRWHDEQWKERGTGECKLLHEKTSDRVIFILRQDSTKKVVCNFVIAADPLCTLAIHAGSDRAFLWAAVDCSDDEVGPSQTRFAIRFNTVEEAALFKAVFEKGKAYNNAVREGNTGEAPETIEDVNIAPPVAKPKAEDSKEESKE